MYLGLSMFKLNEALCLVEYIYIHIHLKESSLPLMFSNERGLLFFFVCFWHLSKVCIRGLFSEHYLSAVSLGILSSSAYFLIPVGLICRVNNLTAQMRVVIPIATKALEENFCSKWEEPTEFS